MWTDGVTLVVDPGEAGQEAATDELVGDLARWIFGRIEETVDDDEAGRRFLAEGFGADAEQFVDELGVIGRQWDPWDETWHLFVNIPDDHGPGMDKMLVGGHWIRRIVDAYGDELREWLSQRGYELLAVESDTDTEPQCAVVRDEVLMIEPGNDSPVRLHRGDLTLEAPQLSSEERSYVERLLEKERCDCPVCRTLLFERDE